MKILIVGAGFSGAVFARLATDAGHSISIIDRRNHIGGNCYSYTDKETGVEVHKYGPHIFHTNDKKVWDFINRYTDFNRYINRVKAITNGSVYSLPINLGTINQYFGKTFNPDQAKNFIEKKRINKSNINNLQDYVINSIGEELYEAFYKKYSLKQWGVDPREIALSTGKRLPIRYNYNDNYFNDRYQGIPKDGYTVIFNRLLDSKNIKVMLGHDFNEYCYNWRENFDFLVYSGSIDEYFDFECGELPYRTVTFKEIRGREIQGNAVINYTDDSVDFTRIHEHKWFTPEKSFERSVAFKEYASSTTSKYNPYYPIRNKENDKIFSEYKSLSLKEKNVIFLGRLAEYKYYDMHQVIASSMHKFKKFANSK